MSGLSRNIRRNPAPKDNGERCFCKTLRDSTRDQMDEAANRASEIAEAVTKGAEVCNSCGHIRKAGSAVGP